MSFAPARPRRAPAAPPWGAALPHAAHTPLPLCALDRPELRVRLPYEIDGVHWLPISNGGPPGPSSPGFPAVVLMIASGSGIVVSDIMAPGYGAGHALLPTKSYARATAAVASVAAAGGKAFIWRAPYGGWQP